MLYNAEDWEHLEISEESACNASAEAAQSHLNKRQLRLAKADIGASINSFLAKTFYKTKALSLNPPNLQKSLQPDAHETTRYAHIAALLSDKDAEATVSASAASGANQDTLHRYSTGTIRTLHDVLHENIALPCQCQRNEAGFKILQNRVVALGLAGTLDALGDKTHRFFDCAIAFDEHHKWSCIQLRVPASLVTRHVTFGESVSDPDIEPLRDFCDIAQGEDPYISTPVRLEGCSPTHRWYKHNPFVVDSFPGSLAPIPVSQALRDNRLSARSKIHLAFVLSRSFCQFYDSDWMHPGWDLDEKVLLLPQRDDPCDLNAEAKMPYLAIKPIDPILERPQEHEAGSRESGGRKRHQHPFILNLCLLLVLLGTTTGCMDNVTDDSNQIHRFCIRKVHNKHSDWPDLPPSLRDEYKKIVSVCLPKTLCKEIGESIEERRQLLEDQVVRPLHRLLTRMPDLVGEECPAERAYGRSEKSASHQGLDQTEDVQSEASQRWLDELTCSDLQVHLKLSYRKRFRRPKIALIDTGYDPQSFRDNSKKKRLGTAHWKDFFDNNPTPLDEDGHGTSMLDLLLRIAPFADICVARIARFGRDLEGDNVGRSQQRLAEAIQWATEFHQADIVSLSLGWEDEHTVEKHWVANAISTAIAARDQQVLFFSSASNYGGGKQELFPARHSSVFSIRATDHLGVHQHFNPSLPEDVGISVYGTMGVRVPTARRHNVQEPVARTGTSPATAIAAGIAALTIAYINTSEYSSAWKGVRTQHGYQKLLERISTETESRKRFISPEDSCRNPEGLRKKLNSVT